MRSILRNLANFALAREEKDCSWTAQKDSNTSLQNITPSKNSQSFFWGFLLQVRKRRTTVGNPPPRSNDPATFAFSIEAAHVPLVLFGLDA